VIPFQLPRRIQSTWRHFFRRGVDFVPNDVCISRAPTPQSTIDIIDGWISILPANLEAKTGGYAPLFDDDRVTWAIEKLGGVKGADVLELGPLEGGHTYMLHQAGAKSITSIEGNKSCYLKCLITKELLGVGSAHVLLGNFIPWLESHQGKFDVIWASGVLYHMAEPLKLLRLLADRTDRLHIWTHFYPDDHLPDPLPKPIVSIVDHEFEGENVRHYLRSYSGDECTLGYCGGVLSGSAWLRRSDILRFLEKSGFSEIEIAFEAPFADNGPSFALAAKRP
jgi:hypothetical protein